MRRRRAGTAPCMFDGYREKDPQSESVSAPHRDDAPPRRTRRTPVLVLLLLLAMLALGVALVWAAIAAA
jgi:hypothetical protein